MHEPGNFNGVHSLFSYILMRIHWLREFSKGYFGISGYFSEQFGSIFRCFLLS